MNITTNKWLLDSLIINNNNNEYITRNGKLWKNIAGFKKCGCIFVIYQNEYNYCVHSADEWNEYEEPNLGYYDINLSYNDLIEQIANNYDKIRENIKWRNTL